MLVATFMGEPFSIMVGALVTISVALIAGERHIVAAEICGFGALGLNAVIKYGVQRRRPDTLYAYSMKLKSYSFPSGHAFGSMYFCGLLACIALSFLPAGFGWLTVGVLALAIVLIGTSRVYLGAHFPSDVVVGWLFGAVCLSAVVLCVGLT